MTDTTTTTRETLGFQAEVSQLLHLMIHSLYGNKEIFLRELVSNASDAVDKLRFEALADGALFENDPDLKIRIAYDTAARTITVSDNGIGMSRAGGDRAHRHHRQVGHARVLPAAHRRPRQGRAPDRPVRRRLLLGVHRRRPRDAGDAARRPRRRARGALGEHRRGRLHDRDRATSRRAAPTSSCTCAPRKTSCCPATACARSSRSTRTTSPSRS